jgi:hypothetical protein
MINQERFFNMCKVMTVAKVTDKLNYSSRSTIYGWISEGRIPPIRWQEIKEFMEKIDKKHKDKMDEEIAKLSL